MFKKIFFFTVFLTAMVPARAQDENIRFLDDFRIHQEATNAYAGSLSYHDIEGSPYLFPDYRKADIYLKNGLHYRGEIRYDLYTDEMEYRIKDKTFWIAPRENIKEIILDGKKFVYLKPREDARNGNFYEVLAEGPCRLLARHFVSFHEAEKAKPYQDPKSARFEPKKELFYLKKEGKPVFLIRNRKTLPDYLGDKRKEISTFIKKNHISVSKAGDLKKLVEYYNGLSRQ